MLNATNKNNYYHIYNNKNPNFDLKLPTNALNTISKLYGEEQIQFNSFILFINQGNNLSVVTQKTTMKKELDDNEANRISERLNNLGKYFIIPESLKELDEDKQFEQSIKIKGKYITHIMKKAGINFESMIFYLGLQIVSQEINENVVIDYFTFEKIFNLISLLSIKFNNKNNLDITFFSFRQIVKNCGIKLEDILPFLHIDIINLNRNNINHEDLPIIKSLKIRQLKELISPEVQNMNIDLMKGTDSLLRINKNNFDDLDICRNSHSNLLNDLIKKMEIKREEIKNLCENKESQIKEIIKDENKVFFVKKNLYDDLIKNRDNLGEVKIKDINGIDVILNKEDLKKNENNEKEPLIKIFKNKNKNEFILIPKDDLENKFKELKYIKQEGNFNGKGINGEPKELKGLFIEINCDSLSEINFDIIPNDKNNHNIEIKEEQIILSPEKENNDEIKSSSPNSKEKLKTNAIQNYDLEPEYENIINPYNNMTFKQIRTLKTEEYKNNEGKNTEEKLRNINERIIGISDKKTYRIRRAILFKRPTGDKEKEEEKEKEKKIS